MEKRKPDGWVDTILLKLLRAGRINHLDVHATKRSLDIETMDVCLVPPSLLDWIEEVRELWESDAHDENWYFDKEARLFNKLDNIWLAPGRKEEE